MYVYTHIWMFIRVIPSGEKDQAFVGLSETVAQAVGVLLFLLNPPDLQAVQLIASVLASYIY
jgi:hypothetical protein